MVPALVTTLLAQGLLPAALPAVDGFPDRHQGAPQDAAVVVGIERYFVVDPVPYAARDAQAFWSFLVLDRGVPAERVSLLKDARGANDRIEREVGRRAREVGPDGTLWFYFAGHGAPDPSGKDGLLVGVDAQETVESVRDRSVSRRWLLQTLGGSRARHVVVFLDACFSGKTARGGLLARGLRPLIPTAALAALPRGAVLTGAKSDQLSGPLAAAGHGLFTYFLLGALRGWGEADPEGPVTVDAAYAYLRKAMGAALSNGDREQEPDLAASPSGRAIVLAHGLGEDGPDLGALATGAAGPPAGESPGEAGPAPAAIAPPILPAPPAQETGPAPAAPPDFPRFVVRKDGTVFDSRSGLLWQRGVAGDDRVLCIGGRTIFGACIAGRRVRVHEEPSIVRSARDAWAHCGELPLAGGGWRLPSVAELQSLLDLGVCRRQGGACIDPVAFPDAPGDWFWSSSSADPSVWLVDFGHGETSLGPRENVTAHVRCVR